MASGPANGQTHTQTSVAPLRGLFLLPVSQFQSLCCSARQALVAQPRVVPDTHPPPMLHPVGSAKHSRSPIRRVLPQAAALAWRPSVVSSSFHTARRRSLCRVRSRAVLNEIPGQDAANLHTHVASGLPSADAAQSVRALSRPSVP